LTPAIVSAMLKGIPEVFMKPGTPLTPILNSVSARMRTPSVALCLRGRYRLFHLIQEVSP
jgi:hypothetical protein